MVCEVEGVGVDWCLGLTVCLLFFRCLWFLRVFREAVSVALLPHVLLCWSHGGAAAVWGSGL